MMNKTTEAANSYVDFATRTFEAAMEAAVSANRRGVELSKSMYDVISRPLAGSPTEMSRDGADRFNAIVDLTMSATQTSVAEATKTVSEISTQASQLGETITHTMRAAFDRSLENVAKR